MTMVTITITLPIEGNDTASPEIRSALNALADVMLVQAEDGLWSLGSPEAENDDGPSQYLRGIGDGFSARVTIHPPDVKGTRLTLDQMPMGGCSTSGAHYAHLEAGSTACENER